ncbi:hypothetical protein CERZMDRAFT_85856 [Cercospora zeae-maydis SCOH1-5]|uniref:Uncharacterized protein n=1 Tax=Cercospora zeae-maydis SCOH1-5 TaxID=717836 RepID=A0A6A6FBY0_9PEZI|nr:hypothetical protein CERZMDRAFT_85856 [Cercospora zeae-maydis SCOH1-5]
MESLQLTMGIELEFAVVCKADAFANITGVTSLQAPTNLSAAQAIQHFLKQAGIASHLFHEVPDEAPYDTWVVDSDGMVFTPAEEAAVPAGWERHHIELQSRVFSLRDDWAAEIRRVTEVLSMMRSNYHCAIISNPSAGFHVHMGNGPRLVPFPTAKRIAQLFTAFESRLDQMHAATRILAPGLDIEPFDCEPETAFWCAPPSFFHWNFNADKQVLPLDDRIHHPGKENVFNWTQRIENSANYERLADLNLVESVCGDKSGHHAALNFENCEEIGHLGDAIVKRTIEFRQHIGTVDFRTIVSWMAFLGRAVRFCHVADDPDFIFLLTKATDTDFTLARLLAALGCGNDLINHFHRMDEGEEISCSRQSSPEVSNAAFIDNPMAADLIARNDDEQSEEYEWSTIVQMCGTKFDSGYYGLDPTAAALPLELADVQHLLGVAMAKAQLQCIHENTVLQPESVARASVFGLLAKIYARLDNALDTRPAVEAEYEAWASQD